MRPDSLDVTVGLVQLVLIAGPAAALLPKLARVARRSPAHRPAFWLWSALVALAVVSALIRMTGLADWVSVAAGAVAVVVSVVVYAGMVWRVRAQLRAELRRGPRE